MLTSPPELLPQIVRPVERDVKASPSTLCIPHDMESKPQIASHSTVSSSCDDGDAQPEHRRSERLQATPKDRTGDKTKSKVCKATPKQSQITTASAKREGRRREESCGDENVAVRKSLQRKGIRGHGRNMALPSAKTQVVCSSQRSMQELDSCDMAKDKDTPESPTAAKSWVIGPLFHSFKSKMASFTEIVMSPVRLFKPTDALPSDAAGMPDGEALRFGKAANSSSSDSVLSQQVHVSRRPQIHEGKTKSAAGSKHADSTFKTEQLENEWNFASSHLTRSALRRGEGPSQPDPVTSGNNQSVLLGPTNPSSSNNVLEGQTLQRRPEIIQTGQNKTILSDSAEKPRLNQPSAELVICGETAVLPHKLKQANSGDEQLDDRMGRLSDSSVFDTPPDSFSNAEGTLEKEELEESTPVQHTRIRSSPRKLSKGISFTPAPFETKRANGKQNGTRKKVSFCKEVKVEDDEEEEKERAESQNMSSDEEVGSPETEESSPGAEAALKRVDRKRIRKPQEVDPEWGKTAKRRLNAGRTETATRKKGKNKDVVKKECLSEWLETSEDILFTKTAHSLVTDSGTSQLSSSHESSVDIDMSGMDAPEAALKFEGSSRLTRRQAKSKQSTPDTVKVDPLENEYTDCFTDHLAVSFYADKSHNDSSIDGRENENSITASVPRKNRQRAKKTTVLDDRSLVTNKTVLKSEDDGSSVFSPNAENSSGSLLSSTVLSQSMSKSGRKRRLMKTPSQMFGDKLSDDSPSASFFKVDNTMSEIREEKRRIREEKRSQTNVEETFADGSTDEGQKTPDGACPRLLKRKSSSPLTEENRVDGPESGEEDCGAFVDAEEPPEATASGSGSNRLLRSYSCPEIASLSHHEQLWRSPTLPSHGRALRTPAPHHRSVPHQPPLHLPHSPSKRARRHTVCSLEIAREIAPLCLRKEVYPTGRGGLYGSPSHPLCPTTASQSTSFTALVSSFLSSPLAFLSRRSDREKRKARNDDSLSTSFSSSSFSPSVSLCASSLSPPFTSSSAVHHSPAGFACIATPSSSHFSDSVSPSGSSPSQDEDSGQQSEDGDENSCLNVEMLSTEIPEEKALSDSEIKMETRQGEQRKVSSIRIRKTLPKPLNNLTPMGLPRLIRPKKKEFSVEEIYTNKNFTKPAEGRLETIFEVPLKRRDGSHCLLGQRRVKRFVEFPELGKVRKLRKPLAGTGNLSCAQKKTGAQSSGGRPRRGAWSTSKDDQQPSPEDLDSLLCSKLDQLDSLMVEEECSS